MSAMTELHVAVLARDSQQRIAENALVRACPVGSEVSYKWGAHTHAAKVVMHGAGLRLFVRNTSTHGARWIGYYMLTAIREMDEQYKPRSR